MPRKTDTVSLSDGRVVPIRQLGWLQLRSSQRAYQQASARNLIEMGGADFMEAWDAIKRRRQYSTPAVGVGLGDDGSVIVAEGVVVTSVETAASDILDGHDLLTVLTCGVPSFTKEQIEDLDEPDAETLGRAILGLSVRHTSETDLGNAPAPSTGA